MKAIISIFFLSLLIGAGSSFAKDSHSLKQNLAEGAHKAGVEFNADELEYLQNTLMSDGLDLSENQGAHYIKLDFLKKLGSMIKSLFNKEQAQDSYNQKVIDSLKQANEREQQILDQLLRATHE